MNFLDWVYIAGALPDLMKGLAMTLLISVLAILFSLTLGLAGCLLRTSRIAPAARATCRRNCARFFLRRSWQP
ncbi:ABC transporter permease [Paracoccus lichenicola]|uniref:hypothetical protein n=1 Tax=Paracoccus lichenicola TaxID=2665644 RepID=UPI0018A92539|nr:hypothetical protein [Paracoccus lichenicola]